MAVEQWARESVLNELTKARDVSETRSIADLREAVGIGHDDLMGVLAELHDGGHITEAVPGEYSLLEAASAQIPSEVDDPGISLDEAERRAGAAHAAPRPTARVTPGDEEKRTTLSRGVAQALDEVALGALVRAGIDEAMEAGATFIFEVMP